MPGINQQIIEPQPAVHADALTKYFSDFQAVADLTFRVAPGEIFGFLGANGAGKTTTIRMLTCLLRPTSGRASVAGYDIASESMEVKKRIGYLADVPFLYPKLTGREVLELVAGLYRVPADRARYQTDRLLTLFDIESKAHELTESYSHGMRKKLALAAVLLHDPQVLFLDEPTSGLDPRSARTVKELLSGLAQRGVAVFLTTHFLEIAEHMCHRVGVLDDGKLIAIGTLGELRGQTGDLAASLEDIFLELTGDAEDHDLAAYLEGQ